MAIRVKLDRLLLDRRLALTELADRVGITIANLSVLKTNKARAIRFSTLEALCRELQCQPGEILEWTPKTDISRLTIEQSVVGGRESGVTVVSLSRQSQSRVRVRVAVESRSSQSGICGLLEPAAGTGDSDCRLRLPTQTGDCD